MTAEGPTGRNGEAMGHLTRHIVIPGMMSVAFFSVAFTPVALLGCRNRGLLAALLAISSGLWAIGTAIAGLRGRLRGDPEAFWWVISTLLLTVPLVAMLVMT